MTPAKKKFFSILSVIGFLPLVITGFDLISQGKEKVGWVTAIAGAVGFTATLISALVSKQKENKSHP